MDLDSSPPATTSPSHIRRLRSLQDRIAQLSSLQLTEVGRLVSRLEGRTPRVGADRLGMATYWPHAPLHRLSGNGTFIVTAGTLDKQHHFVETADLDFLQAQLLEKATRYQWQLEAWACFPNHYHFVGHALEDASSLKPFLTHLHSESAREINARYASEGRNVWHNYWETELTYENSYLARLNYVHQNAVHHGLVPVANQYRWCSAAWFERTATPAQVKTIYGFKINKLKVLDDF